MLVERHYILARKAICRNEGQSSQTWQRQSCLSAHQEGWLEAIGYDPCCKGTTLFLISSSFTNRVNPLSHNNRIWTSCNGQHITHNLCSPHLSIVYSIVFPQHRMMKRTDKRLCQRHYCVLLPLASFSGRHYALSSLQNPTSRHCQQHDQISKATLSAHTSRHCPQYGYCCG